MNHYYLLSVEIPPQDTHILLHKEWLNLLTKYPTQTKSATGIDRLSENRWLFERNAGIQPFSHLVAELESAGLHYHIQFLKDDA